MSKSTAIWLVLMSFAIVYLALFTLYGDDSYFLSANIFIAASFLCLTGEIK